MSHLTGRPQQGRRVASFAGTALLIAGVLLLLAAGALYGYTLYAEMQFERAQVALSAPFAPPAAPAATETPLPAVLPTLAPAPSATATSRRANPGVTLPVETPAPLGAGVSLLRVTETPTLLPASSPTPRPSPTPTPDDRSNPGRLIIPKLKVDADIVIVPLVNGQWDVTPLVYDVGLLEGTGFPGRPGNAAISGHVSLIRRGNGPFRWLERLVPDDEIRVQQGEVRYSYRVTQTRIVLPSDVGVLAPTLEATLTLITCSDWDILRADYSKRLIVTARLVSQSRTGAESQ